VRQEQLVRFRRAAERTSREQRAIQRRIELRDARKVRSNGAGRRSGDAARSGERPQPKAPFPRQHHRKPGHKRDLKPPPNYLAPKYLGSGKLRGRVALITGGDSGIGRAVAVLFAREGADVAIAYLSEHSDAADTAQAVEREGHRCVTIAGDVRDSAFCEAAVGLVVQRLGRLDILVNNAAFQQHAESLEALTDEHLDMTIRTNLCGYVYMARAALKHLSRGGSIVNCGSETGMFGSSRLLDYSASKGAIHAFTKALAGNVVNRGIRVNTVAPGPVWTPLNPADRPAAEVARFGADTAMKRPAQPEEIAPAFVFLASPACSSYITGIELPIMGGVPGG
jgi:NAD(P)-dependent dehydrogenase (short-subunit alcohol dehydrogenase family)